MRVILDAGCMMQKEETHQYLKESWDFRNIMEKTWMPSMIV